MTKIAMSLPSRFSLLYTLHTPRKNKRPIRMFALNNQKSQAQGNIPMTRMFIIVMVNAIIWLFICGIGALGNYRDILNDDANTQNHIQFISLLWPWINGHIPLFILSTVFYILLIRFPKCLRTSKRVVLMYLCLATTYFPLHILLINLYPWYKKTTDYRITELFERITNLSHFSWFIEFAWFTGTFAVTVATWVWHDHQARQLQLQKSEQANLELHLALEQQRLHSLRQQLEPHFIFNALNALSALIRTNERAIALESVNNLSALLRYALNASRHEFVSLNDELSFLQDYMSLQILRYGRRLHFTIDRSSTVDLDLACPPLLLQPLVENALRHDLDCHEEEGNIEVRIEQKAEQLFITVRNSLSRDRGKNPGLGMGQSQTRERLALLFGERASFECLQSESEYIARLRLPCEPLEAIDD